ncbi:MAG: GNAT family N-acetyltransferase [Chthoniobacterales bacterium]
MDSKLEKFLEDVPVFSQTWWLEAVAPGQWNYSVARRGEEIAAVLPYTYKIKFSRWKLLEMPGLTPYLGPYLRESSAKNSKRLGEEKDLMNELIAGLPEYASFQMAFHPKITNWLPFYWKNFTASTRYTYLLPGPFEIDAIWKETAQNIRTDIRKAEKIVSISTTEDFEIFLELHKATFFRQNKQLPFTENFLRTLNLRITEHGTKTIFVAYDKNKIPHAAIYILHDKTTDYYFLSGSDPSLRNSGALSLLIWTAIQNASKNGKSFDFEGSMVESIERFVRAFGAIQTPYFEIRQIPSFTIKIYRALYRLIRSLRGKL